MGRRSERGNGRCERNDTRRKRGVTTGVQKLGEDDESVWNAVREIWEGRGGKCRAR